MKVLPFEEVAKFYFYRVLVLVIFSIFISIFLVSCGYRPGLGPMQGRQHRIAVPYVCGDRDGMFTSEIVRQIAISGCYCYSDSCADVVLKVKLLDREDVSIGFRYETDQYGNVGQRLVASEDRAELIAEIELLRSGSCQPILGPVCLKACMNYDFAPETSADTFGPPSDLQTITRFSLGQLDYREAAADAVRMPLYRQLAKQVVDYISESW